MQVNFPESAHQFEDTQPVSPQLQLQQQQQGPAHTAQRQQQQHQHGALHKAQEQPVLHFQHPRKRKFAQLQGEGQAMVPGEAIFSAKAAAAIAAARMHQHDAAQPSGQQSAQGHAPDSTPQSPDLHPSGQRPAQVHRSGSRQSMHSHLELTADAPSQQGLRQKDRGEILPQQGVGTEDHLGLPAGTQPVPLAGLPKPGLPVWSMPAVLGPRPNSAPGLSTQSLHSAEPQLQPSAEVSKPHATGEAQHSRAPWSAAGLPRAGCAAAASSSGRGSVGLAASWCAGDEPSYISQSLSLAAPNHIGCCCIAIHVAPAKKLRNHCFQCSTALFLPTQSGPARTKQYTCTQAAMLSRHVVVLPGYMLKLATWHVSGGDWISLEFLISFHVLSNNCPEEDSSLLHVQVLMLPVPVVRTPQLWLLHRGSS